MKIKKVLALLFLLMVVAFAPSAFAQNSYADVKVDELTERLL